MTDDASPRGFEAGLHRLQSSWYERDGHRLRLRKNFTLVMLDMLRLSRQCGVWPDRDVIKYIRSAIAIDGLITRMAPDFDISGYLATACAEHLRWHMRRTFFTWDSLTDVAGAAGRLLIDGLGRGSTAMNRVVTAGGGMTADTGERTASPAARSGAVRFGVVGLLAAAVGVVASGAAPDLYLFVSWAVVLVTGARLAYTAWRPGRQVLLGQ
jgi:hypothetical protein